MKVQVSFPPQSAHSIDCTSSGGGNKETRTAWVELGTEKASLCLLLIELLTGVSCVCRAVHMSRTAGSFCRADASGQPVPHQGSRPPRSPSHPPARAIAVLSYESVG